MKTHRILLAAALASLFIAPTFAQQAESATLRVDSGSAMVSTGGEFSTAASGTQIAPGSRVMLAEGSRATLVYPNGCTQALSAAGVYGVPATCVAAASGSAAAGTAAGADLGAAGIIAGVAAAGAVGLNSMDEEPAPPVSR
ncbi:hypothetical protein WCE41_03920 [Luteimonas sp. MJ246]|uniref:hypothetical protein n=1 Tax=Luteimonas sp. MJ174 TaxID=3129237 RepID=UPI0031BAE862